MFSCSVAREFEKVPLDFALALVHLDAEKRDRRYERAALRYFEGYITEGGRGSNSRRVG